MTWSLPDMLRRAGRRALGYQTPRPIRRRHRELTVECLEERSVPTVLTWVNRGVTMGADDDMFDDAFGAQAEVARNVVDAAIAEWNRVVTGFDGEDMNVELTVKMDPTNSSASAFASGTQYGGDKIPDSGNITINMALDANGVSQWFLDPTPDEHSEFMGSIINAFVRNPTVSGPADGIRDLRSILIHEIGHVMGISSGSPLLYANDDNVTVTDTGFGDDSSGSADDDTFWLFQGPSVNALMTSFDINGTKEMAGHNARPRTGNVPIVFDNTTTYGAVDTMIGTGISLDQRVLFTNKLALMLSDLGYDVVMPERFGTFYTVLNSATGVLDIRGGQDDVIINNAEQGDSDDTISLSRLGNTLVVTIDIGVDHPGTGPGTTSLDQQGAFVSFFDLDDITAITINGRGGNDTFVIGDGDFDSDFRDDITVTGGDGSDTLLIDDTTDVNGEPGPLPVPVDFYFLTANTFTKPSFFGAVVTFGGVESVRLDANPDTNVINVAGVASGVEVDVFGHGGNNGFLVGGGDVADNIRGDLLVFGGFGTDTLVIDDSENGFVNDTIDLGENTFDTTGLVGSLTFQFMQVVRLDTGPQRNIVHLNDTSEDVTSLLVNTAGGNDTVFVHAANAATVIEIDTGSGQDNVEIGDGDLDPIDGPVVVQGGSGTDALNIHDQIDIGHDGYTLTSNSVAKTGFALTYDGINALTLDANTGNNIINVESTAAGTAVTVQAGAGSDTIHLAPTLRNLGQLDGAVTVNGQGGTDAVVLHDELFALGALFPYAVTGTTVGRGLFGGLTYGTVEDLQLRLGAGNDTVNITGLAPGTLTDLFGNAGDDTFNFFAPAPAMATGGHLVIHGGSPTDVNDGDTLNVYWQQPKPDIKKHKAGGDHDAGYVSLDYGGGLEYLIDYDDIELVNVEKL